MQPLAMTCSWAQNIIHAQKPEFEGLTYKYIYMYMCIYIYIFVYIYILYTTYGTRLKSKVDVFLWLS